jgi:hypothetical protein
MNDRPMAFTVVGLAFAAFLYTLLNPAAVKASNDARNYKWIGAAKKPIWFYRTAGAIGSIVCGMVLIHILLSRSI